MDDPETVSFIFESIGEWRLLDWLAFGFLVAPITRLWFNAFWLAVRKTRPLISESNRRVHSSFRWLAWIWNRPRVSVVDITGLSRTTDSERNVIYNCAITYAVMSNVRAAVYLSDWIQLRQRAGLFSTRTQALSPVQHAKNSVDKDGTDPTPTLVEVVFQGRFDHRDYFDDPVNLDLAYTVKVMPAQGVIRDWRAKINIIRHDQPIGFLTKLCLVAKRQWFRQPLISSVEPPLSGKLPEG